MAPVITDDEEDEEDERADLKAFSPRFDDDALQVQRGSASRVGNVIQHGLVGTGAQRRHGSHGGLYSPGYTWCRGCKQDEEMGRRCSEVHDRWGYSPMIVQVWKKHLLVKGTGVDNVLIERMFH
jgi:hypothetical protein